MRDQHLPPAPGAVRLWEHRRATRIAAVLRRFGLSLLSAKAGRVRWAFVCLKFPKHYVYWG